MKTAVELKFERIIKEGFHESLKPLGFKKKNNNFYLHLDNILQMINIQKSSWSTKDDIRFTINTGMSSTIMKTKKFRFILQSRYVLFVNASVC